MDNKIREYRKKKNLSQAELAEKVGLARQTVSLLENKSYNPSLKVCLNIANVLDTTLDSLFNPKSF
ncbi:MULTISPECIES: helix-turn-helix transcriptional regulator [Lactobacillaceae]|uniref:DNA-binding protein n=1 Tax=Levilactobacillus brevis TaxID=1580 RepID=C0SQP1_LEVBR|nr:MULTISPECIES: helix-turn-helix transcriptional regulator [Lactobacillaceae]ARO02261.1 transcriptional regulator [Lactiplantibacillus plantarum]ARO05230.1 transcriptional regulator [Lactiplantibacillus plantarum]KID43084.1 transcriptional regulator [Levilactobacillus brevis]QCZ54448.1 DNA-binding protein [Levilactobacillus brevis]BAH56423.1 transcriptional regulator [Levilactobacillus brevis]